MSHRHHAADLRAFATALLDAAGMDSARSPVIAEVLVEADLLGHDTHGLNLLPAYLADMEKGELATSGEPGVIADFPAALTWDGRRLPGTWLVTQAIDLACQRAATQGSCTVAIRRSHHIACLAAYLTRATDRGFVIQIMTSAPENRSVAPFGGREGVITPNPIAAGWPTDGDPVLIDVSTSITTNGMVGRLAKSGERLPGQWLVDGQGRATDDPAVTTGEPRGWLLPVGGLEYGHKGYALGLMVEAFTQGLGGHGRADAVEGWTGEVFVQVLDPRLFAGLEAFTRQTGWTAAACRNTPPLPGVERVRLPGERGLALKRRQLAEGVSLHPGILPALEPWARKLAVPVPERATRAAP